MAYKLFLLSFLSVYGEGILQDGAYIESLASNIEKSGLADKFSDLWEDHIQSWRALNEQEESQQQPNGSGSGFNCNVSRPGNDSVQSVHNLHPSDIGIIGALGASFVAGNGADAKHLSEMTLQYRGVAFPIGGDGNLSTTGTLPNILKEYNPNITGWSRSIAPVWFEYLSQLNMAMPGVKAKDLEEQANELIGRIDQIPESRDQWKMISIFIGIGDLCDACDQTLGRSPSSYGRRMKRALDTLQRGLTHTLVNLIALPSISQWYSQLHDDRICVILHKYLCPCIFNSQTDQLASEYNNELEKLAKQYSDRDDFTVVVQPFFSGPLTVPTTFINGTNQTDQSYFAPDCFHISRKHHAVAARALWRNLFQPHGRKEKNMDYNGTEISCPDEGFPYFRTLNNSHNTTADNYTTPSESFNFTTSESFNFTTSESFNFTSSPIPTLVHIDDGMNLTYRTYRSVENTTTPILTHWGLAMVRNMWQPKADSNQSAIEPWIGLIAAVSVAIVFTSLIGIVKWKRRQRPRDSERAPLLHAGNGRRLF